MSIVETRHIGQRFIIRSVYAEHGEWTEVVDTARNNCRTFQHGEADAVRLYAMMEMVESMYGRSGDDPSTRRYEWAMELVARNNRQRGGVYMPRDVALRAARISRFADALAAEYVAGLPNGQQSTRWQALGKAVRRYMSAY